MTEDSRITMDGGGLEPASPAVVEISLDRGIKFGGWLGLWHCGRRMILKCDESGLGLRPAPSLQRATLTLALLVTAFHPNRAGALDVANAFGSKPAGFFVAAVEAEHGASLPRFGYVCGYVSFSSMQDIENKAQTERIKVQYIPFGTALHQQVTQDKEPLVPQVSRVAPEAVRLGTFIDALWSPLVGVIG